MSSLLQLRTILQDLLLNPRVLRATTIGLDLLLVKRFLVLVFRCLGGTHIVYRVDGFLAAAAKHMWTHEAVLPLGVPKPCVL